MESTFKCVYNRIAKHPFLLLFGACLLSALVFDYKADGYTPFFIASFFVFFVFLIALGIFWKFKGGLTEGRIVFLITAFSFLIKLAYVIYTGLWDRQHDVGAFRPESYSHSGYITRLFTNKAFPDSLSGQYYHPPLHYIFEALWLKALTTLGVAFDTAIHYVTTLTLFYSASAGLIAYKIFKELNFNKTAATISYALVAFHPTFIILSASYNNDCLAVTLTLFALLFLIRWWKKPTLFNIVMIAYGIGFGMTSKLSAAYAAPATAMVFLIMLALSDRKLKLIGQFAVFGTICIPAGLWWSVRLHEKFDAPFGYVMQLGKNHDQYVGFRTVFQRFFDIFPSISEGIYFARGEKFGNAFHEYNIPGAILKTSVFGEWHMGEGLWITEILAYALFVLNILIVALVLFAMIYALFKKYEGVPKAIKATLYVFYLTIMITYVNFCFTHAHDCTMDFRYIVPTVVIGAAFLGMFISRETKSRAVAYIKKGMVAASVAFCVVSSLLYFISNYAAN